MARRKPGPITEVAACWAHGRRKFFELADLQKAPIAIEAVRRIDTLLAIEREINGRPPDAIAAEGASDRNLRRSSARVAASGTLRPELLDMKSPPSVCLRRTTTPPRLVAIHRGRIPHSRSPPCSGKQVGRTLGPLLMLVPCDMRCTDLIWAGANFKVIIKV